MDDFIDNASEAAEDFAETIEEVDIPVARIAAAVAATVGGFFGVRWAKKRYHRWQLERTIRANENVKDLEKHKQDLAVKMILDALEHMEHDQQND